MTMTAPAQSHVQDVPRRESDVTTVSSEEEDDSSKNENPLLKLVAASQLLNPSATVSDVPTPKSAEENQPEKRN